MGMTGPFDKDTMVLIMGAGGPGKPGMHGIEEAPDPGEDAIGVICQIKELCCDFLMRAGKDDDDLCFEGENPKEHAKEKEGDNDGDEEQGVR